MDKEDIYQLLVKVKDGQVSPEDATAQMEDLPFEKLSSGRLDHHRALRRGFPEVICGQGKTPEQVAELFLHLSEKNDVVLCTRIEEKHYAATKEKVPNCQYDPVAGALFLEPAEITDRGRGQILVVAAGTADLPVAREALLTARLMGNQVELLIDVGVAGLQRLLSVMDQIKAAEVVIAIAGMEGAMPSVMGGLCDRPIIAVPTSIGFGTGEKGYAALLSMLNSCVAGLTVVNIDNGFGAGYAAALINRKRES